MNVIDAAYATVHEYPGGSESLGPRVGISPAVLRSKVNPNTTTHHLTVAEANRIMGVSADFRMLHALNAEHGFVAQRIDADQAPAGFMAALLASEAQSGTFARVLHDAMADEIITANELKELSSAGAAVQAAFITLLARLRAVAEKQQARA